MRTVRQRCRLTLRLEALEDRSLPSASPASLVANPNNILIPAVTSTVPYGYTPAQIQQAYGYNQIAFLAGNLNNAGAGQTIAIVDAYNDPNIASDLAIFDQTFGLSDPPTLQILNQNGGTTNLPKTDAGWAMEIALDVEWAHAMAPAANIALVLANDNSYTSLMTAVNTARNLSNVSVVSMSWGGGEFRGETGYDSYFVTPAGHTGVTFVASSGDSGQYYGPEWPATSPNVLAVGGTTLNIASDGTYVSETSWRSSGGGISRYESQPTFQKGVVTQSSTKRTNPDVSYDGNPNSGFAVYDSIPYSGQSGWWEIGGTSAGAPQWAAIVAIANQGRVANLGTPLNGSTQTIPALYQMFRNAAATYYHDIVSGSNGYSARTGYDLVTGLGSPRVNAVVQGLIGVTGSGSGLTINAVVGNAIVNGNAGHHAASGEATTFIFFIIPAGNQPGAFVSAPNAPSAVVTPADVSATAGTGATSTTARAMLAATGGSADPDEAWTAAPADSQPPPPPAVPMDRQAPMPAEARFDQTWPAWLDARRRTLEASAPRHPLQPDVVDAGLTVVGDEEEPAADAPIHDVGAAVWLLLGGYAGEFRSRSKKSRSRCAAMN